MDGKNTGYNLDNVEMGADLAPRFLGDGHHAIWVTTTGGTGNYVAKAFKDGKPVVTANQIVSLVTAPRGDSFAAVVQDHNFTQWAVYLNGREVPGTRYSNQNYGAAPVAIFSPDGKHLAVACNTGDDNAYVVRDGKKGESYDSIPTSTAGPAADSIGFSADSRSFGYFGMAGGKYFAVIDGQEYDTPFSGGDGLRFSPEGHHVAVLGQVADGGGSAVYVDGKKVLAGMNLLDTKTFAFNRNGSHWLVLDIGGSHEGLILDGRLLPFIHGENLNPHDYLFSPDGSKLAVRGSVSHQGFGFFLFDLSTNRMVRVGPASGIKWSGDPVFSPDGKHLYFEASDGKMIRGMGSTYRQDFIYADGRRTDAKIQAGFFPKFQWPEQTAACWAVGPDDKLYALRSANNAVTRFVVTPPAGDLDALW